jgi:hypothetical protein
MKLRDHLKPYKSLIDKLKTKNEHLKGENNLLCGESRYWQTKYELLHREVKKRCSE